MSEHGELADEHEAMADRLEKQSDHVGQTTDDARSTLDRTSGDAFVPESLGQQDPGHRVQSNQELEAQEREERKAREAEEADPDTAGESVDKRLEDLELGQGGERGEHSHDTDQDKTPGGGDIDDPPERTAGGDSDDD